MYRKQFESYFGKLPEKVGKIKCIWHDDTDPSLSIDMETGEFYCYGCGKKGNITELVEETMTIESSQIDDFHNRLMGETQMKVWLEKVKGIKEETLTKYKIGHNGGRYSLPVVGENGEYINLRLYSASSSPKMISYGEGYGKPALFPHTPTEDTFFLFEGEWDTLLARQMGIPGYCQTAGARGWNDSLTRFIVDKKIAIVYDVDSAGIHGAKKVINAIKFHASQVKNIRLPVMGKNNDFSDWVLKEGGSRKLLYKIAHDTQPYIVGEVKAEMKEIFSLKMREAVCSKWAYKAVQTNIIVAGKDRAPYLVPKTYVIECPADQRMCSTCVNNAGQGEYQIEWKNGQICQFVDIPESLRKALLRNFAGISPQCKVCRTHVKDFQNMEKLAIFEKKENERDFDEMSPEDMVLRKAYFIGEGIEANSAYRVIGIPIPDPKDQTVVFLVVEAEPIDIIEKITDTSLCEVFRLEKINVKREIKKSKEASAGI